MGPKDETSAKAAEIGDGLIESLGFEPADGTKFRRSAVAEVSDQLSEAGFAVTDVLEGASDDVSTSGASRSSSDTKRDAKNGSASGNGSTSESNTSESGAAAGDSSRVDAADPVATPDSDADSDLGSGTNGSFRSQKESTSSSGARVTAAATAATAAISANVGQVERRSGFGTAASAAGDIPEVVPFTPDTTTPTSPPTAEKPPAVTGEIPRVDARAESSPTVIDERPFVGQRPVVVGNRTIIERPKSVSDLFSGGNTGRRHLQARKVRRVIRHIDPWSVLTFSVMFHLCLFAALLLASALVFNVAEEAGTIENLENFIRELGDYETFEIDGQAIFKAAVAIAGIMTLAASVLVVLLTVMFNLLSDLLGGVRITVIEEETVRVKPKKSDADADAE